MLVTILIEADLLPERLSGGLSDVQSGKKQSAKEKSMMVSSVSQPTHLPLWVELEIQASLEIVQEEQP